MIFEQVQFDQLPYLFFTIRQTTLSKQWRTRLDSTECGIWSGSTLFATHPTILHTIIGSKMVLLKGSIRWREKKCEYLGIPNLSKISKENEILSQKGVPLNPWNPLWVHPCHAVNESMTVKWYLGEQYKLGSRFEKKNIQNQNKNTLDQKYKWRYPGNARNTKHSLP